MLEPIEQQYVLIGHIAQAHGLEGIVLMIPEHYEPALFETIDLLQLQKNSGELIPARIESVRVQEKNNRLSFFLKFDHITDRNEANAVKNFHVFCARDKVAFTADDQPEPSLISFEVKSESGDIFGRVDEIIGNPAHPLLSINTEHGSLLIPLVDEYIRSIDEESGVIYCKNLDQLSDL